MEMSIIRRGLVSSPNVRLRFSPDTGEEFPFTIDMQPTNGTSPRKHDFTVIGDLGPIRGDLKLFQTCLAFFNGFPSAFDDLHFLALLKYAFQMSKVAAGDRSHVVAVKHSHFEVLPCSGILL